MPASILIATYVAHEGSVISNGYAFPQGLPAGKRELVLQLVCHRSYSKCLPGAEVSRR